MADRARAKSTVYAWHRPADGGPQWRLWAQYHDVVVRTPAGWRIAERRLLVAGSENFPESWGWLGLGRRYAAGARGAGAPQRAIAPPTSAMQPAPTA